MPLGLPGAESIRVPAEQAKLYQLLVGTLRARCRTFVTQPGLNSFYLFTGMEPPTRANTTVWMLLLSDAQQEQIVERLVDAPAPVCALRRQRRVYTTPLARYIEERFVTLYGGGLEARGPGARAGSRARPWVTPAPPLSGQRVAGPTA